MEKFEQLPKEIKEVAISNITKVDDMISLLKTSKEFDSICKAITVIDDPEKIVPLSFIKKFPNLVRCNVFIEIKILSDLVRILMYVISSKITSVRFIITELDVPESLYKDSVGNGDPNNFTKILITIFVPFLEIRRFNFILNNGSYHLLALFDQVMYIVGVEFEEDEELEFLRRLIKDLSLKYFALNWNFERIPIEFPETFAEMKEEGYQYKSKNILESLEDHITTYI